MAAVDRSIYDQLFIESKENSSRAVDIRSGTVSIDYYEDIFSPVVTAKVRVINTGNTIPSNGKLSGYQSIFNGLPLRGGERVSIKIRGNTQYNPGLDFATNQEKRLYVSRISDVMAESQRESFVLHLTSKEAITNETSRVGRKYNESTPIDTAVGDILSQYLNVKNVVEIEKTSNSYPFIGNMKKPFTVITNLASKAVPVVSKDSSAGFFFYQTKNGYYFKSVDSLIGQSSRAVYDYSEVNTSHCQGRDTDFKILSYTIEENQNLIEKLRVGAFSSKRILFNPLTFEYTKPEESVFSDKNYQNGIKNLGTKLSKNFLPENLGSLPTRYFTQVFDVGTLDPKVSEKIHSNPFEYQSQSVTRYNLLFTQVVTMIIPSNTNLNAGDIITCNFPRISSNGKSEIDQDQSGLYMIKELCHHFDTEGSYTSLKLIRDTYGLHGTNNK
jgi:hypothetical protein